MRNVMLLSVMLLNGCCLSSRMDPCYRPPVVSVPCRPSYSAQTPDMRPMPQQEFRSVIPQTGQAPILVPTPGVLVPCQPPVLFPCPQEKVKRLPPVQPPSNQTQNNKSDTNNWTPVMYAALGIWAAGSVASFVKGQIAKAPLS